MNQLQKWGLRSAIISLSMCVHSPLMASGLILYEVATDNAGLANAGAAARAQGPGTIASNIAGLSYIEGTQITAGAQVLHSNLEFSENSNSNIPGNDSGVALEWSPSASFFVSHQVNDRLSVGFGSYGDFGLSIDYNDDWSGRYFLQNGNLLGMSLVPSAAYRVNDNWSIGAGLRAMYAVFDSDLAIDNAPLNILNRSDGQMHYEDSTWGYGANLGVIYQPQQGTRIGMSYTSEVELDFSDGLDLQNIGPGLEALLQSRGILGAETKLNMTVPQTVTVSIYHQVSPEWAILSSVNWQEWSKFGQVGLQLDSGDPHSATLNADYDDTWQLSLGGQYQVSPEMLWNLGMAYDSSPVSDDKRTLTMPMGEAWRLGSGLSYAVNTDTELNLSYELIWMGDMAVDQQKSLPLSDPKQVSGEFKNAWIQALSASMTWKF